LSRPQPPEAVAEGTVFTRDCLPTRLGHRDRYSRSIAAMIQPTTTALASSDATRIAKKRSISNRCFLMCFTPLLTVQEGSLEDLRDPIRVHFRAQYAQHPRFFRVISNQLEILNISWRRQGRVEAAHYDRLETASVVICSVLSITCGLRSIKRPCSRGRVTA